MPIKELGSVYMETGNKIKYCAKSICKYLEDPMKTHSISGNIFGCNSKAEIIASCQTCPNCHITQTNTWIGPVNGGWNEDPHYWSTGYFP